jgi:aryl-alcohol dehydrogenase-like predicted oxidoreductase
MAPILLAVNQWRAALSNLLKTTSSLPLSFGGASISGEGGGYGFGDISDADSISLLNYAKDRGYKIFDTAPIYGFGLSEKRIGQAFKSCRDEVFIISKSGVTWHPNKRVDMTNDAKVTQKMLDQSLRDLDTDYIDLYMIHWPDKRVDIRRPLEVLAKAKLEGKIKHIGLCNTYEEDFFRASEVDKIEVLQSELNFFERKSIDSVIALAISQGLSFMSWGTLDKGILTGRVSTTRSFDRSDCRSWAPWWKSMDKESKYEAMKKIIPMLNDHGHTPLELAVSYNLQIPGVDSILCGTRTHEQIDTLISALDNRVDLKLLNTLGELIES